MCIYKLSNVGPHFINCVVDPQNYGPNWSLCRNIKRSVPQHSFTRSFTLLKRDIFVDPQFCPSTLAFILWVSHHPSFSYSTIMALLGLVGLRASGGLVCGPLSAYVVHFRVLSWLFFFSYWHHSIGSKWPPPGFNSIRVYRSMSNSEHLGLL